MNRIQAALHKASFSRQLMVITSIAILALALASALLNSWEAKRAMRAYLTEQGLQITANLAGQSTLALLYHAADNAEAGVATTLAFPDVVQVDIVDAQHRLLLTRSKNGASSPAKSWRPSRTLTRDDAVLERETADAWHFAAPVYANQAEASPFDVAERAPQLLGYVHVSLSKATLHGLVASLLFGYLLITLMLAGIVLAILRLLARRLIRPLTALSALMQRAEAGESGLRVRPEGPHDLVVMATAFNQMMTVLEERETELQRSRDAALNTAQLKAQFAATVSHEVRTPLNGVVGMLDLLKETALTAPQRDYVTVAWKSSHTLMELINGILDFSKLEAGKLQLDAVDFTLGELVEEVIGLLASQAQQKGVVLSYRMAAQVPARIKSDPLRLRQVLINLVGNALKFTAHGQVEIRLASSASPDDTILLRVEVSDTGIGMDDDTIRHVFDSFSQADRSTTRKYGGTGLGLTICKQLVELFGGEIGVTSQLGLGSTFWFTIPCRRAEDAWSAPVAASPEPVLVLEGTEYRALVVEDNRTNQEVAAGMLAMSGCQCELAADGREALEAARRERFDIIFMDCDMPGMDGYEATASIRLLEAALGCRTPIVAMTANVQAGAVEKCLAAGMDDYLAKPLTLAELRRKLERWLGGKTLPAVAVPAPASHAMSMPEGGPLDLIVFEKLREILGPALQHAVKPFLEDMPAYLEQLEQAVQRGDAEACGAVAHAIKGSSSNLGASALTQVAREMEELAQEQRLDATPPLLARARSAFDAVASVLRTEVYVEDCFRSALHNDTATVLVVEDDRSTRRTMRYILQSAGFQVEEAENGAQALLMLKRLQPDLILMDAVMPVMDGFTACAKALELPHELRAPVLMITSLEDRDSVEKAFAAGASDFLTKPINGAVLAKRVRRIIEGSRAEKRIRQLAYKDVLTGLPNRALFFEQLSWHIEQARKADEEVAVLFLDLNRFKYVNDSLGHDVGDRLLVAVAQRIRRSVRSADVVARLGGDEFTLVLADVAGANAAATAAQNICRALATPFQIEEHSIFVGTSVGIALYPRDGTDAGVLLKRADAAMYRAKRRNASVEFFEAAMEQTLSDQVRLESDLRQALMRQELELHYQPQASLDSGQFIGMEALVRWRHPTRGMISPADFIPLAEETGLINALGAWVLRTACAQLQAWRAAGLPPLRVAVNISVKQLLQKDFDAEVAQVLADTGLPPALLELEITESTLMEQAQDTAAALNRLSDLGVRLAIDDFGTGYSSLAYLKRFPVDILKIDRSFVQEVTEDVDDAAIVIAILALAHSLRLEVVAEGVETEAQLGFLREQGCNLLQGYYLSKPLPADQLARFIQDAFKLPAAG